MPKSQTDPRGPHGKPRPVMPRPACRNCEYFIREPAWCAMKQRDTEADNTCQGHEPRQACRVCGCSHHDPCAEGCWWVEPGLCSSCVEEPASAIADKRR